MNDSPSGRVGLSGPERAVSFVGKSAFRGNARQEALPGRYRVRPSRKQVGGYPVSRQADHRRVARKKEARKNHGLPRAQQHSGG